jgi:uncharacterized membrane protein
LLRHYIFTVLWSLSPLGEAKVGIPFGLLKDLNPYLVLILAIAANITVFPMMMFFLKSLNGWLLRWSWYKKSAFWVAKRAIRGSADKLNKYGYVGLALFVMVPLPGTGVYVGSIVAYIFKMDTKKAFAANAIGITVSSLIVWGVTCLGKGLL